MIAIAIDENAMGIDIELIQQVNLVDFHRFLRKEELEVIQSSDFPMEKF